MPLGTDSESCTDRLDAERHWQIIIDAIRGKEMANVWFEFKCGCRPSELPTAPGAAELARGLPGSVMEDKQA